jgi:hypothetical protein
MKPTAHTCTSRREPSARWYFVAASIVLVAGCDPISSLSGSVRAAGDCSGLPEKGVADAILTVRCPDWRANSEPIRTDREGHFHHAYISWDKFDDACTLHVEREGYEPVDVPIRSVKEGESIRNVFVVLRLRPLPPAAMRQP